MTVTLNNITDVIPPGTIKVDVSHWYTGELNIPSSVRYLSLKYYKKSPLPGSIPNSVTHLELGDRDILPGVIPDSVVHLDLGNHNLSPGIIPNSVTHLFAGDFNRTFEPGSIPNSVTYLELGFYFDQKLTKGMIPNSVTHLTFGMFDQKLIKGSIPDSVTHLTFDQFNKKLSKTSLPKYLTHLNLGKKFQQPIEAGVLPNTITHLDLGEKFQQPIEVGVLPNTITHLTLGRDYKQSVSREALPRSIVEINFNPDNYFILDRTSFDILIQYYPKKYVQYEWSKVTDQINDPGTSMERKIEIVRDMYLQGFPIPVEPHKFSTLRPNNVPLDILRYFSIGREEHADYYMKLSDKRKKLLDAWIYGEYADFNKYISYYNNGIRSRYDDRDFLGSYSTPFEAYTDMRQIILEAPRHDKDIFAWRGLHGMDDFCANVTTGSYVGFTRFMACSVAQEVSCEFAGEGLLLLIELPKNSPIFNLTYIKKSEPEFLLPDRLVFKVVNRFPYDMCTRIKCKELIHIKLVGLYSQDKASFEEYFDVENPEEIRIDAVY